MADVCIERLKRALEKSGLDMWDQFKLLELMTADVEPVPVPPSPPPAGETLKQEYIRLWKSAVIKPEWVSSAKKAADRIQRHMDRYEDVERVSLCPWWLIGMIHKMESGCDFTTHLHNGDPLSARTVQVPRGRPKTGNPPFTWETSAIDALGYDGMGLGQKPVLSTILEKLERYNGWGYRRYHPDTKSPYVWSGTSVYVKGKYVADGKWDPEAVSKQVGCAAILKVFEERGLVSLILE